MRALIYLILAVAALIYGFNHKLPVFGGLMGPILAVFFIILFFFSAAGGVGESHSK